MKTEYNYVYKNKMIGGRFGYIGKITKNNKEYTTGCFIQKKHRDNLGKFILDNNPLEEAVLALDKLIIKHGLDVPLQKLKPKQK